MLPLFPPNGVINLGTSGFGGTCFHSFTVYVYILVLLILPPTWCESRDQSPVETNILIFGKLLGE